MLARTGDRLSTTRAMSHPVPAGSDRTHTDPGIHPGQSSELESPGRESSTQLRRRRPGVITSVAILVATLATGPILTLAHAQVSSDGDMMPVVVRLWRTSDSKGDSEGGKGVVWHLGTKTEDLASLVVTGRDAGNLEPETEYQIFRRDFGDRLGAAHARQQPIYFRRAEVTSDPFVIDEAAPDTMLRKVPRRFRVDTRPTHLTSDPKNHQYLYHMESQARLDGARVDHFLLIRFTRVDLTFEWYADLRPASAKHLGLSLDATDRRWAVEPAGNDPGRLTPIAEAVGHRLIPIATADE